jgi:hypothetical protein
MVRLARARAMEADAPADRREAGAGADSATARTGRTMVRLCAAARPKKTIEKLAKIIKTKSVFTEFYGR